MFVNGYFHVLLQSHVPVNNWVLCRIFLKKRGSGKNEEEQVQGQACNVDRVVKKPRITRPVFYDFMTKDRANLSLAPCSSSSGSSGVTDVVSSETEEHEESSSCNSLSYFRRKQ